MLAEPSASVVRVSTAPSAIPADTATCDPTPCAESANATAALETPTLPGVSGRIPARSSAGMIRTAAASGRSTPKAAAIAAAAVTRSAIESPTQPAIRAAALGRAQRPVDPKAAAIPAAAATRSAIESPTQPAICAAALRAAPEDAEDVEGVAELRPRPRVTSAPGDCGCHHAREQQDRDRPARQHAARRGEREHDGEPHRPHRAQRAGDPADRPEPPVVVERA